MVDTAKKTIVKARVGRGYVPGTAKAKTPGAVEDAPRLDVQMVKNIASGKWSVHINGGQALEATIVEVELYLRLCEALKALAGCHKKGGEQ